MNMEKARIDSLIEVRSKEITQQMVGATVKKNEERIKRLEVLLPRIEAIMK